MAASKTSLQEPAIVKGIPGHEELKIYLERKLFSVDMTRFNILHRQFVAAVKMVDKFSRSEGVGDCYCTYECWPKSVHINFHGAYEDPMIPRGIEELYDNLCEKMGR